MTKFTAIAFVAVAAAVCTRGTRAGDASGRDDAHSERLELIRRLDRLDSRLQRVEAAGRDDWLTTRRAEEIRELVADVLADADARAALQDLDDPLARWDDQFVIQSADGNFRLEVAGQIQVRYVYNRRDTSTGPESRSGFEVRRAKIKLDGHLFTPELGYTVGLAESPARGFVLQSFNIRYKFSDELTALVGRARPPLLREEQVSSKRQLAAERSLVSRAFNQTRSVGLMMRYRTDDVRIQAGFMDASVGNLDPSAPADEIGGDLGPGERWRVSARVEHLLAGRWKEAADFTSFPGDPVMIMIGAALLYQWENLLPNPLFVDTDVLRWTVDLSCEFGGSNLMAYFVGNVVDETFQPLVDQFGIVVQGGAFVGEHWEMFGRYEYGDSGGVAGGHLSLLTIGANRYFEDHSLKWTMDIGYGFSPISDFWSSRRTGWLPDRPDRTGQVVARLQWQLLF